eukprot:COSAG02_NODE_10386_length_1952_cov_1.790610_2_plen_138_part_00
MRCARADRQQYFRDGLSASGFGNAQSAPIAPPRGHAAGSSQALAAAVGTRAPLHQPPQQLAGPSQQPHSAPVSSEVVLEFLSGSGGGATRGQLHQWHRKRLGCLPTAAQAEQLQACLTSLQESFAIYEDGSGRYCPM